MFINMKIKNINFLAFCYTVNHVFFAGYYFSRSAAFEKFAGTNFRGWRRSLATTISRYYSTCLWARSIGRGCNVFLSPASQEISITVCVTHSSHTGRVAVKCRVLPKIQLGKCMSRTSLLGKNANNLCAQNIYSSTCFTEGYRLPIIGPQPYWTYPVRRPYVFFSCCF